MCFWSPKQWSLVLDFGQQIPPREGQPPPAWWPATILTSEAGHLSGLTTGLFRHNWKNIHISIIFRWHNKIIIPDTCPNLPLQPTCHPRPRPCPLTDVVVMAVFPRLRLPQKVITSAHGAPVAVFGIWKHRRTFIILHFKVDRMIIWIGIIITNRFIVNHFPRNPLRNSSFFPTLEIRCKSVIISTNIWWKETINRTKIRVKIGEAVCLLRLLMAHQLTSLVLSNHHQIFLQVSQTWTKNGIIWP